MSFYYSVPNESLLLSVDVKSQFHPFTAWSSRGGPKGTWVQQTIRIGRQDLFRIVFSASFGDDKNALGMGIDDITINNCQPGKNARILKSLSLRFRLSDSQKKCPGLFPCLNNLCVNNDRVCDFGNDCGDRSDESNCCKLKSFVLDLPVPVTTVRF